MNMEQWRPTPELDGTFSECAERLNVKPASLDAFHRRWMRGQMRVWAGYWRRRMLIATLLGKPEAEVQDLYLSLARNYRDHSLKTK